MTRIWLNHWFSSAYNIVNLIKEKETDFSIIGSSSDANSVIKSVCDEWYEEPVLEEKEYAVYCLEFCKQHKVDIFMPRRGLVSISQYKKEFEKNGIKVMVDDYDIVSVLNQKDKAYALFKEKKIGHVPDYKIITSSTQFKMAYEELKNSYEQICFKFVHDEGGRSFRLIDNEKKGYAALLTYQSIRIPYETVVEVLSEQEEIAPMMVMPYLPDGEVSVDCLRTAQGIIMLPRAKSATRMERLTYEDKEILKACTDFYKKIGLEHPCNIQFRYLNGIPYFLEVNTRMSGGIQMSCLASGINIPNIAVNKMLGKAKQWVNNYEEKMVSYVEKPVIL